MPRKKSGEGCYIVTTADGDIIPESSEIRALRLAVENNGSARFVKYGQSIMAAGQDDTTEAPPAEEVTEPDPGSGTDEGGF